MFSSFHSERPCHHHATFSRVYAFELLHRHASRHQLAHCREAGRKARRAVHGRPQELRTHKLLIVGIFAIRDPRSDMDVAVHRSWKNSEAVVHSALWPTDETGWKRVLRGAV